MKKIFIPAVILLFAAMLHAQLPSVSLKNIDGKTINTAQFNNDGKPFIISFFATWCKPCLRELEAIHEVYADWQDETGVKLYAVSIDDAQNSLKVAPDARAKGWEYEVLLDPNGDFKRAMGVDLIPHVFVIDGKGKIASSHTSYKTGEEIKLIEEVRKLLLEAKVEEVTESPQEDTNIETAPVENKE